MTRRLTDLGSQHIPFRLWQISCASSRKPENSRWKSEILRKFLAGKSRVLRIRFLVGPSATISFKFILACNYVFATIASPLLVCFLMNWIFYQSFHIFSMIYVMLMDICEILWFIAGKACGWRQTIFCFEKSTNCSEVCVKSQTTVVPVRKRKLPLHHKLVFNKHCRW